MTDQKDEVRNKSRFTSEWWLEHLEEEHPPAMAADLDLLLENSTLDRRVFKSLEETRQLVKASDEVGLPESGVYYDQLHDRIMAAVTNLAEEDTQAESEGFPSTAKSKRAESRLPSPGGETPLVQAMSTIQTMRTSRKRAHGLWISAFGGLMMLAFLMGGVGGDYLPSRASDLAIVHGQRATAQLSIKSDHSLRTQDFAGTAEPTLIASSVISFEDESDVVDDAITSRMRHLSTRQLEEVFHSRKQ